jgi:hypothetical protein
MLRNVNNELILFIYLFHIFFLASEFGSMTSAWKAIMAEADASAEVHQTVHDELQNDIVPAIKSWQKTKYIKSMMHIKTTKDFDDEFRRVRNLFCLINFSNLIIFE